MIPYELFKILRLRSVFLLIVLIMSFVIAPAYGYAMNPQSSGNECSADTIKKRTFYSETAHRYLAIRNGTVTTVENENNLYTITHSRSYRFYIFDPREKKYICLKETNTIKSKRKRKNRMKKKNLRKNTPPMGTPVKSAARFVAKKMPDPAACLFKEVAVPSSGHVSLQINNEHLQINQNGKQTMVKRPRHHSVQKFIGSKCKIGSVTNFCKEFRHAKTPDEVVKFCANIV